VAARAAALLGVPYGFSVHALDARKVGPTELGRRARAAACVVVCNADAARAVREAGGEVRLVPHGVDLDRFAPVLRAPRGPVRLLAVGRLVEKKGFGVLLRAAARLRVPYQLRVVGDGPERERLASLAAAAGDAVELIGARTHAELPVAFRWAEVLVVPSIVDARGDRDGLPNVVLEAMASGLPVVASDVAALPTAVVDGSTGVLVPPGDVDRLARALEDLAVDPARRQRLGRAGRLRAEREFDVRRATRRFGDALAAAYG